MQRVELLDKLIKLIPDGVAKFGMRVAESDPSMERRRCISRSKAAQRPLMTASSAVMASVLR